MKPSQIGFFAAFAFVFLTFPNSAEETMQVCFSKAQLRRESHLSTKIKNKAIFQYQEYSKSLENAIYIQKNSKNQIDQEICEKRGNAGSRKENLLKNIQLEKMPKA